MCYQATRTAASPNYGLSVIDPGGQPFATGVGGTFLGTQSGGLPDNGTYPGESVWNDGLNNGAPGDQASGTGGGVSDQWPMPGYQSSAAGILNVIQSASSRTCGAQFCRQVPDVSADADPNSGYDVYSNGGWGVTGGTSAAAPLWAAFTALANASATCRGLTLGFENPALYAIAGSAYAANFHDITQPNPATAQANNDTFYQYNNPQNPSDDYPVQAGYDMATGLGSPVGNVLGPSLCSARSPVYAVTLASPGNQLTIKGHAVSLGVAGTDSGGAGLTYAAAGLPAGLAMSPTGVISGTPTTNQSTTVTVSATDGYTNTGSTQFTWSVVTPTAPRVSSTKLSGLGKRKPKLTLSVIAGQFAPALKSVSIKLPGGLGFAKKAKTLAKGISVKSGGRKVKFSAKASHGVLTISLKTAVTSASVTLSSPAITITAGEASKVHRHKVKKLKVTVKATDASNHSTGFAITLKKLK
jgi:kumamolisin